MKAKSLIDFLVLGKVICNNDHFTALSENNDSKSLSEGSETSTRRSSLVKWRCDSEDECNLRVRTNSRVFGTHTEKYMGAQPYFEIALNEGRVEVGIVGRRARTYFSPRSTKPMKCIEFITRIKVIHAHFFDVKLPICVCYDRSPPP